MMKQLKADEFYDIIPNYTTQDKLIRFEYINYSGYKEIFHIDLEICNYNNHTIVFELIDLQKSVVFYAWVLRSSTEKQILKKRRKEKFEKIKTL